MYISIRRYHTKLPDDLSQRVRKEFVPLISKARGFVAYYAIEAGVDLWASISIFGTQKQAEDSNRLAAAWAKKSGISLADPPEVTAGKVVAQKTKL